MFQSSEDIQINGTQYSAEQVFVVPLNNEKKTLIKAMFDKVTTFEDSLFYDVSSWTLPLAFNVDYETLQGKNFNITVQGRAFDMKMKPKGEIIGETSNYAYAFEWTDYYAPKVA